MMTNTSLAVMAAYIIFTFLISYLVNRWKGNQGGFSTGRQQFGWLTAGISILATYVSSMSFIGVPGWVYDGGLQAIAIHLNYPIVIFFAVTFFVPLFYKLRVHSIYEYLEMRFGVKTRVFNSIIFIIVQCISSGIVLYAVALVLEKVLPVTVTQAIILISLFTAIYTYFGGIATVIWTDVLQAGVLIAGCFAILYFLIGQTSGMSDFSGLEYKLQVLNLSSDFTQDTTLWAGLVAASFLHLSVYGSNQLIIQRTLATRSLETAQKSMLVCGYGGFLVYLLFSVIGLMLFVFYQGADFENSNNIILDFVFNHTSPLVVGLVMSSLIAAAMSSLDSAYNSVATVAVYDLYKRFMKKEASGDHYERVARRFSLLCSVLVVIPSFLAISNESVLKNIASLMSVFVGIRLGTFLLGIFSSRSNEVGALVASAASIIAILVCRANDIAWPWYAPVGTVVFLSVGLVVSRYYGQLSKQQCEFVVQQNGLFKRPAFSHYFLLIYCLITLVFCAYLPEMILWLMKS